MDSPRSEGRVLKISKAADGAFISSQRSSACPAPELRYSSAPSCSLSSLDDDDDDELQRRRGNIVLRKERPELEVPISTTR